MKQIWKMIRLCGNMVLLILLLCIFCPSQLWARTGIEEMGPLIQTTTFQSDFEGLVYYNLMENALLKEENHLQAVENVRSTFVRIFMGDYYASGNIFDITKDEIIIISNRHALQYWQDDSYITLVDGTVAGGRVLYLSDDQDIGFISIPTIQFSYEKLLKMRCVRKSRDYYDEWTEGDSFFVPDLTGDDSHTEIHQGTLIQKNYYIPDFDAYMIYAHSFARSGMSGSGMFDERGAYVGMLTAGSNESELVGIGLPDILAAYQSAVGNSRYV